MNQENLHKKICEKVNQIEDWYNKYADELAFPIYSSFDVRDSNQKICPVDANIFPAGFNNICDIDKENSATLIKNYLQKHYPSVKEEIVLLTEEHTQNAFYWENVYTIKKLIEV